MQAMNIGTVHGDEDRIADMTCRQDQGTARPPRDGSTIIQLPESHSPDSSSRTIIRACLCLCRRPVTPLPDKLAGFETTVSQHSGGEDGDQVARLGQSLPATDDITAFPSPP